MTEWVQVHRKLWLRPLDNTGALNLMVHATDELIPHWQAYLCLNKAEDPQIIWAELLPVTSRVAEDAKRAANVVVEARLVALTAGVEVVPDIVYVNRDDGMVETRYRDGTVTVTPAFRPGADPDGS